MGASSLTTIPRALYEFLMDGVPDGTVVILRHALHGQPNMFERIVRQVIHQSGHLKVRWMIPEPGIGPGASFLRDNEMVALADLVLAFFAPNHAMEGGTGHVVETAIDRNVPVYSWTLDETLSRVGDHDPDAIWQEQVSEYFDRAD